MRQKLSAEEQEILDRFERGELRPVVDVERELEAARQAARKMFNKTRRANPARTAEKTSSDR